MNNDAPVRRYQFADCVVETTSPIAELLPAPVPQARDVVRVEWHAPLSPTAPAPPTEWYHQWGEDHELWARFGDTGDGYIVDFPSLAEFRISHDAAVVRGHLKPGVPEFTGRHLLLNQILPLVLSRRGRLVLHAGAVAIGGEVFVFIGPTGSGKSTLVAACADRGAELVADDSVVIVPHGDRWLAWPSYPAIRLWSSAVDLIGWEPAAGSAAAHYTDKVKFGPATGRWRFASGPMPFSTILRLGDNAAATAVAVDLYSQVFRLDVRDRRETVHLFHQVADVAAGVRVLHLTRPIEDRVAPAVAAALCSGDPVAGLAALGA